MNAEGSPVSCGRTARHLRHSARQSRVEAMAALTVADALLLQRRMGRA
ncbi:MAG: hypothetical protein ACLSAH_01905 [Bilophila wadsworthia]